jgi:hypothetical protein
MTAAPGRRTLGVPVETTPYVPQKDLCVLRICGSLLVLQAHFGACRC